MSADAAPPQASSTPHSLAWHAGQVGPAERARLLGQQPRTVWLTGLSAAGKSTLAFALEAQLHRLGRASYVLDGDNVRHGLNRDLGFSAPERSENIRRIAEVARLMNEAGLIVIAALISPLRADRAGAREIIGSVAFREVHVSTSLAVCESRDPKGLYLKARQGQLREFTGVSAPYEVSDRPDLTLDTALLPLPQALAQLLALTCPPANA